MVLVPFPPESGQYMVHLSTSILKSKLLNFTSYENPSEQNYSFYLSHNYTTTVPKQMMAFSIITLMIYYVFSEVDYP